MSAAKHGPLQAIRKFCMECQGNSSASVAACNDGLCPFSAYRTGTPENKRCKPQAAIKHYCLESCQAGGGSEEVKNCQGGGGTCPVFRFRR